MTPMIDLVFQLISFFMVVSNFEQTQADERVKLPLDRLARPPLAPRENELVINIGFVRNNDGSKVDPVPFIFFGDEQIRVLNFGPNLGREAAVARLKKVDPATMTVSIRADRDVPTGLVQELIKLAQEAGFSKFALKAQQDSGQEDG